MQTTESEQKILILAGMHRSGTSLTASLLQSAGLHIGRNLLEADHVNVKGHFENTDFYEFHMAVLKSQGVSSDGWTLQDNIEVPEEFVDRARELVEKNALSSLWGWKEPRTTLFLDFWAELLPTAKFLLIYRSPWDVADSLYRRGDELFKNQPDLAIKYWIFYNQKVLNFCNRYPDRCLLANIQTIVNYQNACTDEINRRFQTNLNPPDSKIYDPSLFKDGSASSGHRPSLIDHYFPEALEMYQELEGRGWHPRQTPDLSWHNQLKSSVYSAWAFQDWADLRRTESLMEQFQTQLHETEEVLEKSQVQLHHTESTLQESQGKIAELNQTKSQLNLTQKDLEQAKSQLSQAQWDVMRYQSQLHSTQEELEESELKQKSLRTHQAQLQSQLNAAEMALSQTMAKLHRIQKDWERNLAQLHQTQAELEGAESQRHQSKTDLERLQSQLYEVEQARKRSQTLLLQTQGELEQYQTQLEQTQHQLERLRLEQSLSDDSQLEYKLSVWKAWSAYSLGDRTQMVQHLRQSMKCKPFSRSETVLNWLESFARLSAEKGKHFDATELTNSEEWKQLLKSTVAVKAVSQKR